MPLFRQRIERTRDGGLRVRLPHEERQILRMVAGELAGLLEDDLDRPDLRRLFPPAYEDAEQDSEYRELVRDGLVGGRRRAVRTLRETADRERLDADEAKAWLGALNDARLVLGTRLDVQEDTYEAFDPEDERAPELAIFAYLSWLQEQVVAALAR